MSCNSCLFDPICLFVCPWRSWRNAIEIPSPHVASAVTGHVYLFFRGAGGNSTTCQGASIKSQNHILLVLRARNEITRSSIFIDSPWDTSLPYLLSTCPLLERSMSRLMQMCHGRGRKKWQDCFWKCPFNRGSSGFWMVPLNSTASSWTSKWPGQLSKSHDGLAARHSLVAGRHADLRRVLHALGAHRPEVGYAQGMSLDTTGWDVKKKCKHRRNRCDVKSTLAEGFLYWMRLQTIAYPDFAVELRNQSAAVFLKLGFEEEAAFRMMDAIMQAPLLQGVFRFSGFGFGAVPFKATKSYRCYKSS